MDRKARHSAPKQRAVLPSGSDMLSVARRKTEALGEQLSLSQQLC